MRYIIRSVQDGKSIDYDKIEAKKKAAKTTLIHAGLHYIEYEATLGTLDALGERIEERVIVIEPSSGDVYL